MELRKQSLAASRSYRKSIDANAILMNENSHERGPPLVAVQDGFTGANNINVSNEQQQQERQTSI